MSTIPFNQLHAEVCLAILQKAKLQALIRLRQTCKEINSFVEDNRIKFNCSPAGTTWTLRITADLGERCPETRERKVEILVDLLKDQPNRSIRDLMSYHSCSYNGTNRILDPYSQLSSFKFNHIFLIYKTQYSSPNWQQQILSLLDQLHPSCDLLCIASPKIEIFHRIRFSKVFLFTSIRELVSPEDYLKFPIWHCDQHDIRGLETFSEKLIPLAKNLTKITYGIACSMYNLMWPLKKFLMEVVRDRKARGTLTQMTLMIGDENPNSEIKGIPGLSILWKSVKRSDEVYYIMTIKDGIAMVVSRPFSINIQFVNDRIRERLFDMLFHLIFQKVPFDASGVYDAFITTKYHEDAVTLLYKTWPGIEVTWTL